ncbi:uncharacterized protein LY79DRAFT_586346 [Colletotrichum navitas]|uniref:Uncharacterized protein n=1 Tax=Colletotrichum navitas TaxID=681940 RepID=A0AAD8VC59_9PEZI|nr:uncharacterized protein LY79DRAFT_586346 [Colletotrichum navitas]KAK1599778.1 hypothetical protein LY79DRAFT_586346 [Colletotrichum navitas]
MHRSWFSYPITKPYPFRWFTPVVVIGGLVLAVLLSLANLSANGFYLKSVYIPDPNATEDSANGLWYRKPPFNWQSDVQAECQPRLLSVGDSFFTSNQGFRYTVEAIEDSAKRSQPAIRYKNNVLRDCVPTTINLRLRKVDTAAPSWWISWLESTAEATVRCGVVTDDGLVTITLATTGVGRGDRKYGYVVNDDYQTRAGVWWGTRLLNTYWSGVMSVASQMSQPGRYVVRVGLTFNTKPLEKDIQTDTFFDLYWWMTHNDSVIANKGFAENITDYNSEFYGSPTFTEGLHYAKILYSLLSLDLGSCQLPSLLLDDDGLRYAILAPGDFNRVRGGLLNDSSTRLVTGSDRYKTIPSPGDGGTGEEQIDLKESYGLIRPLTGPLDCSNATVVTQYLCSVPQQKGWGVLLFSILLADLVFLQAAWKILTWVSDGIVARQSPEAMSRQSHNIQSESYELIDGSKVPHRAAEPSSEER